MSIRTVIEAELGELAKIATAGYFIGLHIRFISPLLTFKSYDRDWTDHYTRNGYAMRDPVVLWGFSTTGHILWNDPSLSDPFGVFREAERFGLKHGLTVSCGPIASRSIASFARSDRQFDDAEISTVVNAVRHLHAVSQPPDALTPAQIDALKCIAAGDRIAEAAERLGISESAFKARIQSARTNLMARTTAEAIQTAKDYGMI